eukprot:5550952-Amphidinium_carterae.1
MLKNRADVQGSKSLFSESFVSLFLIPPSTNAHTAATLFTSHLSHNLSKLGQMNATNTGCINTLLSL